MPIQKRLPDFPNILVYKSLHGKATHYLSDLHPCNSTHAARYHLSVDLPHSSFTFHIFGETFLL